MFKICWAINAITTLIITWFFINGLMNGFVNNRNIKYWLLILIAAILVLIFSVVLHRNGQHKYALILFAILAVPAVTGGLLVLLIASGNNRWN